MNRNIPFHRLSPAARRLRLLRSRQEPMSHTEKRHNVLSVEVLHSAAVETVFDIHPHSCSVGVTLRQSGYHGRIITFESEQRVWEQLRYCSMTDEQWLISQSAIRRQEEVIVQADKHIPVIGTRIESAIEVFCEEGEAIAVWISQPDDVILLDDILACPQVRVLSLACTITERPGTVTTIEAALATLRQSQWDIITVQSRPAGSGDSAVTLADVLAVRIPTAAW